jgi:predicted MFS family arabinose efflux permease
MNYGVFQEYYTSNWTFQGNREITGIIGTTSNGIMYLSMPIFFALFSRQWSRYRQTAALVGALISSLSFLLSSFSTQVWHLVATQGVMAALGCALIYSTTTLSLGEWYNDSHRALAYGVCLSAKNVVGSTCPFFLRYLLDHTGYKTTMWIWAGIAGLTSIISTILIPNPLHISQTPHRARRIPWDFLRYQTFWISIIAIVFQSSGYGIPQTYLATYAHEISHLSGTVSTLLITLFNVPGIIASFSFSYLTDNKRYPLSATTVSAISAIASGLSVLLFWGLTTRGSLPLFVLFSSTFGFFAGGYSAIWGGLLNDMEREAVRRNGVVDTGMVYGLMNGARGIGYVSGGLISVPILKMGQLATGKYGYGSSYGTLILFTGLSTLMGSLNLI